MNICTRLGLTALLFALVTGCGGGGGDNGALTARIVFPPEVGLTDAATITVRGTAASTSTITSVVVGGVNATSADGFQTWVAANVPLIAGVNILQVEISDDSGTTDNNADSSAITRGAATDRTGGGVVAFNNPQGIALDVENGRALVVDDFLRALISVDLATGDRVVISDDTTGAGNAFGAPRGIVLNGNTALVSDATNDNIVEVDLGTGNRVEFTPGNAGGTSPNFPSPDGMAIDAINGELLLVGNQGERLIGLDLADPDNTRRIVSDNFGNGVANDDLDSPTKVVLDGTGNAVLVVNRIGAGSLVRVNLTTGDRTTISDNTVGAGDPQFFQFPEGVALEDANTALVQIRGANALVRINLTTGDRTIIADDNTGAGPSFQIDIAMTYDPMTRIAYVFDTGAEAVFAVDTDSGDRVILSR